MVCLLCRFLDLVFQGEATVVEHLQKQDDISQRVVHGEDNHSWQDTLQHSAQDIEDISGKPNNKKHYRKAFSRAASKIFDDLR